MLWAGGRMAALHRNSEEAEEQTIDGLENQSCPPGGNIWKTNKKCKTFERCHLRKVGPDLKLPFKSVWIILVDCPASDLLSLLALCYHYNIALGDLESSLIERWICSFWVGICSLFVCWSLPCFVASVSIPCWIQSTADEKPICDACFCSRLAMVMMNVIMVVVMMMRYL